MSTKVRVRFRVSPLQKFRRNLLGAEKYLDMYYELRQLKNLGRRGALSKANDYLLWLPRATVVSAVGALDAYVHDALAAHLPALLADEDFVVSELLADAVGTVMPTKKREDIDNSLRFVRAANGPRLLAEAIREKISRFKAFQAPDKVVNAFKILGIQDILSDVAVRWQGPKTTRDDIAARLDRYSKRRNQIAHEADVDTHGGPRAIAPDYSWECKEFIRGLVERIDLCLPK
jgi:hypothetical protein